MKLFYIIVILTSGILLSACEKRQFEASSEDQVENTLDATVSRKVLSTDNLADIKHDFIYLDSIINAPELVNLKEDMGRRINEGSSLSSALAYGKTTTELYYNKLNEFEYKSSEISAIKDKLQEGLQLSIEAYDISSKVKLNDRGYPEDLEKWDELDELQQRMNQSADELNEDFKAVRLKLEKAAETAEEKVES